MQNKINIAIQKLVETGQTQEEIIDIYLEEDLLVIADAKVISTEEKYYELVDDGSDKSQINEISKEDCEIALEESKENEIDSNVYSAFNLPSDSGTTIGGYFTNTITLLKLSSSYFVTYSCRWLQQPVNTKIDAYGILLGNLTYQNIGSCYYKADYVKEINGSTTRGTSVTHPTIRSSDRGACCEANLYDDYVSNTTSTDYSNHQAYMSLYATRANASDLTISTWGEYYHQELAIQVSPGVTIGGGAGYCRTFIFRKLCNEFYGSKSLFKLDCSIAVINNRLVIQF